MQAFVTNAIIDDYDVVGSGNTVSQQCNDTNYNNNYIGFNGYQNCTMCEEIIECYWCWNDDNYESGFCYNGKSQSCQSPQIPETNSCNGPTIPLIVIIIAILIPVCCFCGIIGSCFYLCMRVTSKRVDPTIDPRFYQQPPGGSMYPPVVGAFYPPVGASGQPYVQYVGQDPYGYGHAVPTNAIVVPNSQVSIPILDAQVIPMTTMKPQLTDSTI